MARGNSKKNKPYSVYSVHSSFPFRNKVTYSKKRHYVRRPTEFHEALFSFGKVNKTRHLSDSELTSQIFEEIGFLIEESVYHFGCAIKILISMLFGK